ncbi:MAG TPA: hypothetical protein VKV03_12720 [Candidatus Binataceae bacterium]|nr:hypothetical protein [Candidatus Binataceae bacterium]
MKIDYALLADAAQAVGGKMFILGGGWNIFRSANFPAPVQLAIAIGIGFAGDEIGIRYPVKIVIADETGVPVVPEMNGQIETGQLTPDLPKGLAVKIPMAWNVSFAVPRAGRYTIVVTVGSSQADLSFDAIFVGQRVQFGSDPSSVPPSERGN